VALAFCCNCFLSMIRFRNSDSLDITSTTAHIYSLNIDVFSVTVVIIIFFTFFFLGGEVIVFFFKSQSRLFLLII